MESDLDAKNTLIYLYDLPNNTTEDLVIELVKHKCNYDLKTYILLFREPYNYFLTAIIKID